MPRAPKPLHAPCVEDRGTHWSIRIRYRDGKGKLQTIQYRQPYDPAASPGAADSRATAFQKAAAVAAAERHSLRIHDKPRAEVPAENSLGDWVRRLLNEADGKDKQAAAKLLGRKGWPQEADRLRWILREAADICDRKISDLGPSDFSGRPDSLAARRPAKSRKLTVTPATTRRLLAVVSLVYNHARSAWGFRSVQNPIRQIEALPAAHDERKRIATVDEWRKVRKALAEVEPATLAAIECLRWSAARRSEIVRLQWKDIEGWPRDVVATLRDTKSPKQGEHRERTSPLPPEAVDALRRLLGRKAPPAEGLVFIRPDGRPVLAGTITRAWVRACRRAKVEGLRLHDLRHTRTTEIAKRFPNMLDTAAITGHRDLRMLARYYHPDARELGRRLRKRGR